MPGTLVTRSPSSGERCARQRDNLEFRLADALDLFVERVERPQMYVEHEDVVTSYVAAYGFGE